MTAETLTPRERRIVEIAGLLARFKNDGQPDMLRIERSVEDDDAELVPAIAEVLSLRAATVSADDLRRIALPPDDAESAYATVRWYRAWIDGQDCADVLLLDAPDDKAEMRDELEKVIGYDGGIMIIHVVDRAPADHWPAVRRV